MTITWTPQRIDVRLIGRAGKVALRVPKGFSSERQEVGRLDDSIVLVTLAAGRPVTRTFHRPGAVR